MVSVKEHIFEILDYLKDRYRFCPRCPELIFESKYPSCPICGNSWQWWWDFEKFKTYQKGLIYDVETQNLIEIRIVGWQGEIYININAGAAVLQLDEYTGRVDLPENLIAPFRNRKLVWDE